MKKSIILAAAMSAVILAGCANQTELVDDFQDTEAMLTESKSDETDYILGGETEAAVSETEAQDTDGNDENNDENAEAENEPIAEMSWKVFDYSAIGTDEFGAGHTYGNAFLKDNIFCTDYIIVPDKGVEGPDIFQLRFYDIEKNELLGVVEVPDGWGTYEMIPDAGEDILCRYIVSCSVFNEESGAYDSDYKTVTVRNDFSSDITNGYTVQDSAFEVCGHNIAERDPDIIDADSGEIIVAGKAAEDDYDFSGTRQMYYFPVDENRFVYRTVGYESLPGFGIYDFSTGTATDVPDSKDLVPLGVHDGKIYSVKTAWDGFGKELFVTDAETLKTEFFMDCPLTLEGNDFVEYAMPESGDYIALKYLPEDEGESAVLYGINPDTKELVANDVPDELKYYTLRGSSGNRVTVSNNNDIILIAEITV